MLRKLSKILPYEQEFINWAKPCFVSDSIMWKFCKKTGYGLEASSDITAGTELLRVPSSVWKPYSAEWSVASLNQGNPSFLKFIVELSQKMMPNSPQLNTQVQSTCLALNIMNKCAKGSQSPYIDLLRNSTFPNAQTLPHPLLMEPSQYLEPYLKNSSLLNDILTRQRVYTYIGNALFHTKNSSDEKYLHEVSILVNQFKWAISKFIFASNDTI